VGGDQLSLELQDPSEGVAETIYATPDPRSLDSYWKKIVFADQSVQLLSQRQDRITLQESDAWVRDDLARLTADPRRPFAISRATLLIYHALKVLRLQTPGWGKWVLQRTGTPLDRLIVQRQ